MPEKDHTDIMGYEQAQEDLELEQTLAAEQLREDFRAVAVTQQGRRFLWVLLVQAGVYRSTYLGDVNDMLFREGQRNLGLKIVDKFMKYAPELYQLMTKENANG